MYMCLQCIQYTTYVYVDPLFPLDKGVKVVCFIHVLIQYHYIYPYMRVTSDSLIQPEIKGRGLVLHLFRCELLLDLLLTLFQILTNNC